jgi:uncharacterized protein YbaA (DUF1428 family)
MTYVDGFVIPVPPENEAAYRKLAADCAPIFIEFGAVHVVENWEDDVSDGKVTDFRRAVNALPGEKIVFSWITYPDKATRDAAHAKMVDDPRFAAMGAMPFDGKRMVMGGFSNIVDQRA